MNLVRAKLSNADITTRKARLSANKIRGMYTDKACQTLLLGKTKASRIVSGVLQSAIANARYQGMQDRLRVEKITVDKGASIKRVRCGSRHIPYRFTREKSHISIHLTSILDGTKSKS